MTTATTERRAISHYRTYAPRPFTRAERGSVTILFGGLHWRVERILQAVLESGGNRAEILPVAHYLRVARSIYLTGAGFREIAPDLAVIAGYAVLLALLLARKLGKERDK